MNSLGGNIKIHFAGTEDASTLKAAHAAGAQYFLYSCYRFVKTESKHSAKERSLYGPIVAQEISKHVIMDSGLYTLMFGAEAGRKDKAFVYRWQERMIDFVLDYGLYPTVVECDCQKILGVEEAWDLRVRLKDALPDRRIINVFHYEDGKYGLDRLIEYSDYLAISVPELRNLFGRNESSRYLIGIARYIKKRKPDIDIHLLGCTDYKILPSVKWCTSADSTSWRGPLQWNHLNGPFAGKKTNEIRTDVLVKEFGEYIDPIVRECGIESETGVLNLCKCYFSVKAHLREYARYAGPQD